MRKLLVVGILLGATVAHAEERPRFALAVNNPIMWVMKSGGGTAFAISGYVLGRWGKA